MRGRVRNSRRPPIGLQHKSDAQHNTLVLSVQGDIVQGLELVANMRAYEFTFDSLESVQQMAMWLSEMCSKVGIRRGFIFARFSLLLLLRGCAVQHCLGGSK